jgi:hypothetical protein
VDHEFPPLAEGIVAEVGAEGGTHAERFSFPRR